MSRSNPHKKRTLKMLLAVILSLLAVFAFFFGMGRYGWITMIRLNRQKNRIKREMLVNLSQCEILSRQVKRLKNDKYYLEIQARENLGMVKPGESSYRFYPADSIKKRP
jgi:cell division protein FtsB